MFALVHRGDVVLKGLTYGLSYLWHSWVLVLESQRNGSLKSIVDYNTIQ